MRVIYTGDGSLTYRSAPSGTAYVFFAGVPQDIKSEDEQFFKGMASNQNNPWRIEGLVEAITKSAADTIVDAVGIVTGKLIGKGMKKGAYKGDGE